MRDMMRVMLECPALGDDIAVLELDGEEGISQLFDHRLTVLVGRDVTTLPEDVIGERATLRFEAASGDLWVEKRVVFGIVCECEDVSSQGERSAYRLRLVPHLWLTTLVETLDLFLDMSVPDIIRSKLALLDLQEGTHFELRLDESAYPKRDLITQYKETDLAFLSRLCEHEGIFYFFEHRNGDDVVVFADEDAAFQALTVEQAVDYVDRADEPGVFQLHARAKLTPQLFVQRDYNYRNPGVDLTASAESAHGYGGGIIEYGGHFKTEEEGKRLARVRSEERTGERKVVTGRVSVPHLGAASTFTLQGHPRGTMRLRVTRLRHRARQSQLAAGGSDNDAYVGRFEALEAHVPFRPRRATPRPRIGGMVTGIIDGPEVGAYAHLDDQGRYRVRFMFDTSGRGEGKASRPVRMMQPHAGAGFGMHFPLRVGTEVLVTFLDGDPDRPIIAGTVPNPQTPSPVAADNGKKNIIRTGGANEIDIDDTEDEQRVKISTPYGSSVLQLGAPNAAENGAFIGTTNNVTTAAGGTANTLTTFQSNWNTFNDTWSVHTTSFAGPTTPLAQVQFGLDSFRGIATTISGITGSVMAVQDAIIKTKELELEQDQEKLRSATESLDELEHERRALAADVDACIAGPHPGLPQAAKDKLAALGEAKAAYDAAVAKLETDIQARDTVVAAEAEAEEAGRTTTAEGLQEQVDTYNDDTLPDDREDIEAKRKVLATAASTAADDSDLKESDCGETLVNFEAKNAEYAKAQKNFDDKRREVESTQNEIATTKDNQSDSREDLEKTQEIADTFDSAATTFTAPLFSLVTTLWGTGMQGYARNVSDVMLTETAAQAVGFTPILNPPKYGWAIMPPFMATKPPVPAGPHTNPQYGRISRELWQVDMLRETKMLPGGGAGLFGAGLGKAALLALIPLMGPWLAYKFSKGAFAECRNIVGSEDHTVLFGMKSAFIHGTNHVAVSSANHAVLSADKRVEVHSRGKTEIAGGDVLVSAAKALDVEARGEVSITATGPADGSPVQTYAAPNLLDKKRSVLTMKGGKAALTAYDNMGAVPLAKVAVTGNDATPTGKIEIQTGPDNAIKVEQGAAPVANQIKANTAGTVNVTGGQGIELTSGQSSLCVDQTGVSVKVGAQAELSVKMDELVMKLGPQILVRVAQDKVVLAWGPTQVVLRASALELKGLMQQHS